MQQKVALVTGGLKGIGGAISHKLADLGYHVYATSRQSKIESHHPLIIPITMDITDEDDREQCLQKIETEHGRLDLLVNNAGIGVFAPFEELAREDWEKVYHINVFGAMAMTHHVFPYLKKQGGRIVQVSSIATKRSLPNNSVYASSKMALRGFGEVLAEEWFKYSIGITNIHLGATYTDIWKGIEGFDEKDMLSVDDVARVVSFIAETPLHVRIDELTLTPPKGIL